MIRFNPGSLSNHAHQQPIGTNMGQFKLSKEAQSKAGSERPKTLEDFVKIVEKNPAPEQNISSKSLQVEKSPGEALDVPKAVGSVKNDTDSLDDFVIIGESEEVKLDAINSSKSFLENEHIVNFCAFFSNIFTSPPVVIFLAIAAVAGLFQCSLAGLAITSTTGTLAIMILSNCYPKVQALAGLVGAFATVYFTTQQARHSAENIQQGAQAMGGVAEAVLPVAQAALGRRQQPQQQEQPARQPEIVPAPLQLANRSLDISPMAALESGQTLTEMAAQAPRLGRYGRVALGVGALAAVGFGTYYGYQWYQNRNKSPDGEDKQEPMGAEEKELSLEPESKSNNRSFLGSVGQRFVNAGQGLAREAGRDLLLNAPGFIIRGALGF